MVRMAPESHLRTYGVVMTLSRPYVAWWGRLKTTGADLIPAAGPLLLVANHDSYWDPVVIGVAANKHRQIRALAKASLWKNKVVGKILDGMGQIPILRGQSDAKALDAAIEALRSGVTVGVFPEGTISRGTQTRPRSGAGRLAVAVPEAKLLCARVIGSVDLVRFPKRPKITVEFFEPAGGQPKPGESPAELMERVTAEIRNGAPYAIPGRKKAAAKYRAKAAVALAENLEQGKS